MENSEESGDFAESFAGLAAGGGDDEDGDSGVGDEAVDGEDGGDGRFSPLAVAIEGEAAVVDGLMEDFFLGGVGNKVEEFAGEIDGIEGGEGEASGGGEVKAEVEVDFNGGLVWFRWCWRCFCFCGVSGFTISAGGAAQ